MGGAYPRFLMPPAGSFFLLGIRGVGKSTWARKAFPEAHVVDLLDERRFHALAAAPGTFADEIRALPGRRVVVVDEVQRLPLLLNEVHRAMEDTRRRFVLLGSSARRAALDACVQLYVREEIRAEALVRNLPAFVRFLPVAASFHGQVINISGLARDAATSRTTIEGYVEILEETLLATRLPAFESRLRARERKHPKLYWVDPGLVRAAKQQLGELAAEERGPLVEGLELGALKAHNATGELFDEIAYRSPAQSAATEVDFVLRRGREHLALEVKHQTRTGPELLTGLRAIADLPKLVRRIAIYRGRQVLRTDDRIDVWPFAHFAEAVAGSSLWP